MSQIQIGSKVQAQTFRLRGFDATVLFIGAVAGKDGTWIGIRLDLPKGDMDGTSNGEFLFECEPNHGALVRPNQVKLVEENPFPQAEGASEEPARPSAFGAKSSISSNATTSSIASFMQNRIQNLENPPAVESNEASKARSQNWKNKIEELRLKKQQEQAQTKPEVVDPQAEEQKKDLGKIFAPAAGLNRANDGSIAVNQDQAQKPVNRFAARMAAQAQAAVQESQQVVLEEPVPIVNEEIVAPVDMPKAAVVAEQKPIGSKLGGLSKFGANAAPATGALANKAAPAGPKAAGGLNSALGSKLKNDLEEKKDKIAKMAQDRQNRVPAQTTSTKPAQPKISVAAQPSALVKPTEQKVAEPTGKLGASFKKPVVQANPPAATANQTAPSGRPMTARTTAADKAPVAEPGSAQKRTTMGMSKLGQNLAAKLNKPATKVPEEMKQTIIEAPAEEEQPKPLAPKGPLSALKGAAAEQPQQYSMPTDEQLMLFMLQTGGVSQDEHKKIQDDLRKKKEENYSLQLEVKELSSKINQLQQENQSALDVQKTEYEIKLLELEQQLGGDKEAITSAAENAASAVTLQLEQLQKNHHEQMDKFRQAQVEQLENAKRAHQEQVQALQQQIQEMEQLSQKSAEGQIKAFHDQIKGLQEQLLSQQAQSQEHAGKIADQVKQLNSVIEFMKQDKLEQESEQRKLRDMLAQGESEKEALKNEVEEKQADIEIIQLEVEALKDEKEELLTQMKLAAEMNQEDALAGLSEDELKSQNQKLRQAISSLSMNFEVEKSRMTTKLAEVQERARLVDEYEKKLEEMDLLLEEIDAKEQEKADMEAKLDECLEFEKMVEEMAEEIMNKEDENEGLQQRIKELEENLAIQEELNENQDDYINDLNEDIANKDVQLADMQNEKAQLEEMILDADQQHQRYKDKMADMASQLKLLQDQLQTAYAAGDSQIKVSSLIEKQNSLVQQLREAGKKDTEIIISKIHFWQEKLRMKVIEGLIPNRLHDQTHLDSLEKVQNLNITKNKALLLLREICEKQLTNVSQLHEEPEQQALLVKLLFTISDLSVGVIEACSRLVYCMSKLSVEKYQEVTAKMMAWGKLAHIGQFIEKVLELLKEGALTSKFDIAAYVASVKSIQDLLVAVEAKHVEKNEGEEGSELARKRDAELKDCPKIKMRNECVKMLLAVTSLSLSQFNPDVNEEAQTKARLIYWRLLDIIYKLDSIEGHLDGADYINLAELGTDTRMHNKQHVIKAYMWGDADANINTQEKRDWVSVLEAVERDITSLINDYKFKKLIARIQEETKDQQVHLDDIYTKGWEVKGPWNTIVEKIRQDFEDTEVMKEKIETYQGKVKEQAKQQLLLKREKEELSTVNASLESRLSEALMKAEQVPTLELDKKRLQEREKAQSQDIELVRKELEAKREKEKDLLKKIEDLENNPVMMPQPSTKNAYSKRIPTVATPSNGAQSTTNRQTSRADYFKRLSMSSLTKRESTTNRQSTVNAQAMSMTFNSDSVNKQLLQTEETLNGVILELQKDRMAMRGQNMMERLKKMEKSEGSMSQFIAKQRDRQETMKRFSRDDQAKLEGAVETMEALKTKVKKEMALIKVIDLTKTDVLSSSVQEQQKGGESNANEKINYLLVKAKDQVNDAFDILFAKDSHLNHIRTLKESLTTETTSTVIGREKLKVGSLRIQGLPLLKKVVTLNEDTLANFKSNLAVFAS